MRLFKNILFFLFISISARSQTFIGMKMDEIVKLQEKNGNKLSFVETDSVPDRKTGRKTYLNKKDYNDSKFPISHSFMFSDKNICVAYCVQTYDKHAKDSLQKSITDMCVEKVSNSAWVQKINGSFYGWQLKGSDSFFSFSTTQIK